MYKSVARSVREARTPGCERKSGKNNKQQALSQLSKQAIKSLSSRLAGGRRGRELAEAEAESESGTGVQLSSVRLGSGRLTATATAKGVQADRAAERGRVAESG